MIGGWEEAWPEGKEKLTSEKKFIALDKKLKKESMKYGVGYYRGQSILLWDTLRDFRS